MDRYVELPYPAYVHGYTHPDHLAATVRLHGLLATPPKSCRVLELGCASGANLIPMAFNLPDSQFVGVDPDPGHVREASGRIAELGLCNIRIEQRDLRNLEEPPASFDYLICHGVFSWVAAPVRVRVLELCRQLLAEDGLAFVSYNARPGWYQAAYLHDLLRYHAQRLGEAQPLRLVEEGRRLADLMTQTASARSASWLPALAPELQRWSTADDAYLYHEFFETHNQPFSLVEFLAQAQDHGLRYAGEACPTTGDLLNHPPPVLRFFQGCGDPVSAQQYLDFFTGCAFRSTLLCHADHAWDGQLQASRLFSLWLSSSCQEDPGTLPLDGAAPAVVHNPDGRPWPLYNPLLRRALSLLHQVAPQAIAFEELAGQLAEHSPELGLAETFRSAAATAAFREYLAQELIRLAQAELVVLHTAPLPLVNQVSDRPQATMLARTEAIRGTRVTSQRHLAVFLDQEERSVLLSLDGSRTRPELNGLIKPVRPLESLLERFRARGLLIA